MEVTLVSGAQQQSSALKVAGLKTIVQRGKTLSLVLTGSLSPCNAITAFVADASGFRFVKLRFSV
jgi:hypothetical protein